MAAFPNVFFPQGFGQPVAGFPNAAPIFVAHSMGPQVVPMVLSPNATQAMVPQVVPQPVPVPVAVPTNNHQGAVVFSSPPMVKFTSFEQEFLRPTVAAENPAQASALDQADGRVDAKFFGASVTTIQNVPHNDRAPLPSQQASIAQPSNPAFMSTLSSMSVLPSVPAPPQGFLPPAGFTTSAPPFAMAAAPSFSPGVPVTFSPSASVLPPAGIHMPAMAPAPAGMGRVVVPAGPQYHPITSYQDEFLHPTVTAKTMAEAQALDAADGRVDSRFFGAQVVTR